MKKNLFLLIIIFCFIAVKGQDLSQQLINIHNVSNIAAMNAIANPNNQSLSYVESEQLTYQFIDGNWVPFKELGLVSNYVDSIITIAIGSSPNTCCPDAPTEVQPSIGDIEGCGIVFYVHQSLEWGFVAAFDEFNGPFGCVDMDANTDNSNTVFSYTVFNGQQNTQTILDNCNDPNSAAAICGNYSYGGCNDWFLPDYYASLLLIKSYEFIDPILVDMGLPVSNPANNHKRLISQDHSAIGYPNRTRTVRFYSSSVSSHPLKTVPLTYRPIRKHYF